MKTKIYFLWKPDAHWDGGGFWAGFSFSQGDGAIEVEVDLPEITDARELAIDALKKEKLFGPSSIYCITITTEEVARAAAASMRIVPVAAYDIRALLPSKPSQSSFDDADYENHFD